MASSRFISFAVEPKMRLELQKKPSVQRLIPLSISSRQKRTRGDHFFFLNQRDDERGLFVSPRGWERAKNVLSSSLLTWRSTVIWHCQRQHRCYRMNSCWKTRRQRIWSWEDKAKSGFVLTLYWQSIINQWFLTAESLSSRTTGSFIGTGCQWCFSFSPALHGESSPILLGERGGSFCHAIHGPQASSPGNKCYLCVKYIKARPMIPAASYDRPGLFKGTLSSTQRIWWWCCMNLCSWTIEVEKAKDSDNFRTTYPFIRHTVASSWRPALCKTCPIIFERYWWI